MVTVTMVTGMAITRDVLDSIKGIDIWMLVYGRRKVGKTYLIRNFLSHDEYILIKRGGGALFETGSKRSFDDNEIAMDMIIDRVESGKVVVVDEFQRLPTEFIDRLQMVHPRGQVILMGSSFKIAKDLLSSKSPLLGLLAEVKMTLMKPSEIVMGLSEHMNPEDAIELGTYLRDPWTIPYFSGTPDDTILRILKHSREAIPALIGEIFLSEERYLSRVYEGILRSLSNGKTTLKEVADQLHSRGLIASNDPSSIRQYISNMESMDLIQRIPVNNRKGNYYSVRSKIMDLYFYIDEKYGFDLEGMELANEVYHERSPRHIESFIGEILAQILKGSFQYRMDKDSEVDIIITRRNRTILVGEVKWSEKVKKSDIRKFLRKVEDLDCRKVLITKKKFDTDEVECLTPDDLIQELKALRKNKEKS